MLLICNVLLCMKLFHWQCCMMNCCWRVCSSLCYVLYACSYLLTYLLSYTQHSSHILSVTVTFLLPAAVLDTACLFVLYLETRCDRVIEVWCRCLLASHCCRFGNRYEQALPVTTNLVSCRLCSVLFITTELIWVVYYQKIVRNIYCPRDPTTIAHLFSKFVGSNYFLIVLITSKQRPSNEKQ